MEQEVGIMIELHTGHILEWKCYSVFVFVKLECVGCPLVMPPIVMSFSDRNSVS